MSRRPKLNPGFVVDCLESIYGPPGIAMRRDPMDELISCILSQHTSDKNSFPAFERLKSAFPTWEAVMAAGPEGIHESIRQAGLANQKSKSICACLGAIHQRVCAYSIDFLRTSSLQEARKWLEGLPGVGPKTASIVLCFSFGMGAIPVDTHVFRVGWRLGFYPKSLGEAKAHDALLTLVPGCLAFRFHVALIQHGRELCKAPKPRCAPCPLKGVCAFYGSIESSPERIGASRS